MDTNIIEHTVNKALRTPVNMKSYELDGVIWNDELKEITLINPYYVMVLTFNNRVCTATKEVRDSDEALDPSIRQVDEFLIDLITRRLDAAI